MKVGGVTREMASGADQVRVLREHHDTRCGEARHDTFGRRMPAYANRTYGVLARHIEHVGERRRQLAEAGGEAQVLINAGSLGEDVQYLRQGLAVRRIGHRTGGQINRVHR